RQVSKQGLSGTVVDLGKAAEHTSFSTSELRDLFSLTDTPCLTHDLLSCSCSTDGSLVECVPSLFALLSQTWRWRRWSMFLTGLASSVVRATAGGLHRSISACPSSCGGNTSPVTHTPSQTLTSITHEATSPSPSRPPSPTQPSEHLTYLLTDFHTQYALLTVSNSVVFTV
ncbi:hypothetical protein XENOCAPTIV_021582, partial [Xenoophorus captivus]